MSWGSDIEVERRNRMLVLLWAYAYEVMDESLVPDAVFDAKCREIKPEIATGHFDDFFRTQFSPDTGMWIYKFPEANGIAAIYQRLTGKPAKPVEHRNTEPLQTRDTWGFKTYTEAKLYLASIGFRVVPDTQCINGRWVDVDYDTDFVHATDINTGEQISISYKELGLGS